MAMTYRECLPQVPHRDHLSGLLVIMKTLLPFALVRPNRIDLSQFGARSACTDVALHHTQPISCSKPCIRNRLLFAFSPFANHGHTATPDLGSAGVCTSLDAEIGREASGALHHQQGATRSLASLHQAQSCDHAGLGPIISGGDGCHVAEVPTRG